MKIQNHYLTLCSSSLRYLFCVAANAREKVGKDFVIFYVYVFPLFL